LTVDLNSIISDCFFSPNKASFIYIGGVLIGCRYLPSHLFIDIYFDLSIDISAGVSVQNEKKIPATGRRIISPSQCNNTVEKFLFIYLLYFVIFDSGL